jgi:hypothetical protein
VSDVEIIIKTYSHMEGVPSTKEQLDELEPGWNTHKIWILAATADAQNNDSCKPLHNQ